MRTTFSFTDEGFGSLDADTLRVAMDALDGLQGMPPRVGVISHVQEMTERIGVNILVQRASGEESVADCEGLKGQIVACPITYYYLLLLTIAYLAFIFCWRER